MTNEKKIIFCIGSNESQAINIERAKVYIRNTIPNVSFSACLESKDVKGGDKMYVNCLGMGFVSKNEISLEKAFKHIEKRCGGSLAKKRNGIVLMDIDILYYDKEKRNISDWERPYVKELIKEMDLGRYI